MHKSCEEFERATLRLFKIWSFIYDAPPLRFFYFNAVHKKTLEAIAQFDTPLKSPQSALLDVACGTGEMLMRLHARYPRSLLVGIDFSSPMLRKAAVKTKSAASIILQQATVTSLPFPDCSFDTALCSDALHHFANPQEALREINRVIKPGAILFILDPVADTLPQQMLFSLLVKPWDRPKCYYSKTAVCTLLDAAGFGIRAIFTYHLTNCFIAYRL